MTEDSIGILNYKNAGNIHSVYKAALQVTSRVRLINTPRELNSVSKIILPGVGSYREAIASLQKLGFMDELKKTSQPILGICVGMQVLSRLGYENGLTPGLNLIDGEVKPIVCQNKVPHVGFNNINVVNESKLLKGLNGKKFYFMHSYEFVNYQNISALTDYMGHQFVSAIEKDNIFGVQFHPEKSRRDGITVLENFLKI